jgi:hypothetical protein
LETGVFFCAFSYLLGGAGGGGAGIGTSSSSKRGAGGGGGGTAVSSISLSYVSPFFCQSFLVIDKGIFFMQH